MLALIIVLFGCGAFQLTYIIAPYAIIGLIGAFLFYIYKYIRSKETKKLKFVTIYLILFITIILLGKLYPSLLNSSSSDEEDFYFSSDSYQGAMD